MLKAENKDYNFRKHCIAYCLKNERFEYVWDFDPEKHRQPSVEELQTMAKGLIEIRGACSC